jgi:hypothetical protein
MALAGTRVLEFAGLAPAPFCGMILADFGADVIRVDRAGTPSNPDNLARGKRSIAVDLKKGADLIKKLVHKVRLRRSKLAIFPSSRTPGLTDTEILLSQCPGRCYY